jgi:hypothetical protein
MQKLAKEFGLSDVGLAKPCRRHCIPLPGRGYGARIQFGQKPERARLPALKKPRLDTIRVFPSEPKGREDMVLKEEEVIPTIAVAEDRPINHPPSFNLAKSLRSRSLCGRA